MGFMELLNRRWTAYRIEHGQLPRGRTAPRGEDPDMGGYVATFKTKTMVQHFDKDGQEIVEDRREVLNKKFTTAARDALIDAFTNTFELESFNYHDCGTGGTAESNAQTALVTPWGGARVAGTQSQPQSDTYQTVATITFNGTFAIVEHAIFSASSNGTMLDRSVFSAINVVSGDSIAFTFTISCAAEA